MIDDSQHEQIDTMNVLSLQFARGAHVRACIDKTIGSSWGSQESRIALAYVEE